MPGNHGPVVFKTLYIYSYLRAPQYCSGVFNILDVVDKPTESPISSLDADRIWLWIRCQMQLVHLHPPPTPHHHAGGLTCQMQPIHLHDFHSGSFFA